MLKFSRALFSFWLVYYKPHSKVALSFAPILFTDIRLILPVSRVILLDGFSKTILWSEVPNSATVTGLEYTVFIFVHILSSIDPVPGGHFDDMAECIACL